MAALSIHNSSYTLSAMSGRRVPLSSNPNAANSPYRSVATAASKQKRSYATIQREDAYGQQPPAKKQMIELNHVTSHHANLRSPSRQTSAQAAEGRVFSRRSNASQPTAFDRRLEAVKVKPSQQVLARAEKSADKPVDKSAEQNLETVRQWQKHYRRVFPTFVFYFESIPEDVRVRYSKQVVALGAVSKFVLGKIICY